MSTASRRPALASARRWRMLPTIVLGLGGLALLGFAIVADRLADVVIALLGGLTGALLATRLLGERLDHQITGALAARPMTSDLGSGTDQSAPLPEPLSPASTRPIAALGQLEDLRTRVWGDVSMPSGRATTTSQPPMLIPGPVPSDRQLPDLAEQATSVVEISPTCTDHQWRIRPDSRLSLQRADDGVWLIALLDATSRCHLGRVPLTVAALPITTRADQLLIVDQQGRRQLVDLAEQALAGPGGQLNVNPRRRGADGLLVKNREGVVMAVKVPEQRADDLNALASLMDAGADLFLAGPSSRHAINALSLMTSEVLHHTDFELLLAGAEFDGTVTVAKSAGVKVQVLDQGQFPAPAIQDGDDVLIVPNLSIGSTLEADFDGGSATLLARLEAPRP